ncbi:MAG TPA: L-threonylcarbamoyladenylate synthase [Candidatus Thermoplasmatota archaeon]|nr:L-threonylcarbamoyladenylate synthase [Candidatus Thermoplasmatota archaeon]
MEADDDAVHEAVRLLDCRELVAYPTDTLYGLGADALDEDAVLALFEAKGRPPDAAVPVLVADLEAARHVARVTPLARILAAQHWPGALTLVLPALPSVPDALLGGGTTVAVRVPRSPWALDLAREFGPVTATSANRHGEPPARDADEAAVSVPGLALVVDGGRLPGVPSTIVDATGKEPKVLREGAVRLS